jgi:3,4-dihydroxy 2-butanone 4-phosphate synthase/GTP cyclohydrolase II
MRIQLVSRARIPTTETQFELRVYRTDADDGEHMVLQVGDLSRNDVLIRVHSQCFTGDVLGSLRCDCGEQLAESMKRIARHGHGAVLYLPQEGRGIGLAEKLKAYNLQDDGYDTVEANLMLGHEADARDYASAAMLLRDLGVSKLRLLTNNPAKVEGLTAHGLEVTERVPIEIGAHRENHGYLRAKAKRMRHMLDVHRSGAGALEREPTTPIQVTLSYAQSLDGSITAKRGESLALSSPDSRVRTHELRAAHDAILIGIGTLIADDPRLTVRHAQGAHPQPVVLDSALRLPSTAKLLSHPTLRPWVVTTPRADAADERRIEEAGGVVIRVVAGRDGRVDLGALLDALHERGIRSLMVKGGAAVITSFLSAELVDRVAITVAPVYVGGLNAVENSVWVDGHLRPHLRNPSYERVGCDLVLTGDIASDEPRQ